jgi:carboxypeptidase T
MTRYLSAAVAVLVLVFCCGRTVAAPVPAQPFDADGGHAVKSLIRVDFTSPQVTVPLEQVLRTWDVAGSADTGQSLDLVVTSVERRLLETAGVPFKVLIEDIEAEQSIGRASYHSFPEMEAVLSALATDYPNITQLSSLGQSWQGREIWCLEISDNPGLDEGEVGVMFMGLHHAREWPTLEICLEIADRLTSGYGSDPTITDLVNNRRVWVIPCVNPDGYVYCHDQGHDWRKNRRYFPEFGTYGVDLNRNYAGSSDGDQDGPWGSIGPASVSHNSDTEVYCGPWPFSEVETQAIQGLVDAHDVTILITYHTHGELVLWPWGYDTGAHTDDNALLTSIGQGIASQIAKQYGGTYDPMQSANLYPTTGDTADWAYGYRYYELGKNTLPYTIEMCASFHPSEYQLQSILDENWDGALYALQEAADAANQLIPYVLPPFLSTPQQDSDGNFTVSWVQQNPEAEANLYELHELTGLSRLTDGAEGGAGNWSTQYFSTSTQRKHSGSYSFKSSPGDQRAAAGGGR